MGGHDFLTPLYLTNPSIPNYTEHVECCNYKLRAVSSKTNKQTKTALSRLAVELEAANWTSTLHTFVSMSSLPREMNSVIRGTIAGSDEYNTTAKHGMTQCNTLRRRRHMHVDHDGKNASAALNGLTHSRLCIQVDRHAQQEQSAWCSSMLVPQ